MHRLLDVGGLVEHRDELGVVAQGTFEFGESVGDAVGHRDGVGVGGLGDLQGEGGASVDARNARGGDGRLFDGGQLAELHRAVGALQPQVLDLVDR